MSRWTFAGRIGRRGLSQGVLHLVATCLLALMALGLNATAAASASAPSGIPTGVPTGTDCLHPPDPESPSDGLSNFIDSGPAVPVKGDPFRTAPEGQPQPTLYDVYGYAGLTGVAFDDGCDPRWNPFQLIANALFGMACVTVALAVWLYRTVMSGVIGQLLDPIQSALQQGWGIGLLLPLLGLAMTVTGIYFIWKAREADVAEATHKSAVSALIITAGVVATVYPLLIGATVDRGIDEGMGAVTAIVSQSDTRTDPGDAVALNLHEAVLYSAWQQGTFGVGELNQKVADAYGPRLFAAKAFTRDEAAYLNAHPDKAEELADKKREAYKAAALEIQEKYPTVYPYVAGNKSDSWVGFALLACLSALVGTVFLMVALVKIAYAIIALRFTIGLTPGVALVSQHPKMHHLAASLGTVMWDALTKAAFFGVSAIVFVIGGIGGILDPDLAWSPLVKIAVLLLATVTGWMLAKRLGLANDLARLRRFGRDRKQRNADHRNPTSDRIPQGPHSSEDLYSPPRGAHDPYRNATPAETKVVSRPESGRGYPAPGASGRSAVFRPTPAPRSAGTPAVGTPSAGTGTAGKGTAGKGTAGVIAGALGGAAKATALGAATGGTGAVAAVGQAGARAALGAAKTAAAGASATSATRAAGVAAASAKAVDPAALYHPERPTPRPTAAPGTTRPVSLAPAAIDNGRRVYSIYSPAAAGASPSAPTPDGGYA